MIIGADPSGRFQEKRKKKGAL